MVKQQRRSEKTPEQIARLDLVITKITQNVSSERVNERGRRGIIKLTDRFGRRRSFYDHQVIAAQKLWMKDKDTPLEQGRKAGLAALHDMGLGALTRIQTVNGTPMLSVSCIGRQDDHLHPHGRRHPHVCARHDR